MTIATKLSKLVVSLSAALDEEAKADCEHRILTEAMDKNLVRRTRAEMAVSDLHNEIEQLARDGAE